MKKIILAAVLAAVLAAPAFAEVQNVKLSGGLNMIGVQRNNFDLGALSTRDEDTNFFITQTNLDVNADLTDQVSATIGLMNERVWGDAESATTDGVDLYLAYVTLREFLYSPLTIVAGKQAFKYGNSFVVDAAGQNNDSPSSSGLTSIADDITGQTTLDAIRAILDYNPLVLELLWAKIEEQGATAATLDDNDHDLYGINATYNFGDEHNTQVEAYFFADMDRNNGLLVPTAVNETIYVPGVRASINVTDAINLQGELAYQFGDDADTTTNTDSRDAWGGQFIGTWAIPGEDVGMEGMKPTLQYVYSYTSGDDDSTDDENTAWNSMYENQAGGTIYNSLFDLTNSHIHALSLSAMPVEDVTTKVTWTGLWTAEEIPSGATTASFESPDGGQTLAVDDNESALGHEVDVDVSYAYTEDVKIGASLGWFFPGNVFTDANSDAANQALVNAKVVF